MGDKFWQTWLLLQVDLPHIKHVVLSKQLLSIKLLLQIEGATISNLQAHFKFKFFKFRFYLFSNLKNL